MLQAAKICRWLGMLLLLSRCALGLAAAPDLGHIRFVNHDDRYVVNGDGTFVRTLDETRQALTQNALDVLGKQAFTYSGKMESFRVIGAETIKADGSHIPVEASAIQMQDGMLSAGLDPSMGDYKLVVITFPQLAIGDSIHYQVEFTQREALFPGQFDVFQNFYLSVITDAAALRIDAPADYPIRISQKGMQGGEPKVANGRRIWEWHYRRDRIEEPEEGAADAILENDYVAASTFPDYQKIGAAYYAGARDKALPTPDLRTLADELTHGISDRRHQAEVLYDWVRHNIRYVATYIGAGGWVPHDAGWVYAHRYGDCKDHVTLLEALLAAKGIASEAALISADASVFTLPPTPVRIFNHIITYLPEWQQYVDATNDEAPFGVLNEEDSGKTVVHATEAGRMGATPMPAPDKIRTLRLVTVKVNPDGSADADIVFEGQGWAGLRMRYTWRGVGQGGEERWLRASLRNASLEGSGTVDFTDHGEKTRLHASINVSDFLSNTEAGAVNFRPVLSPPATFTALFDGFRRKTRAQPFQCYPTAIHDELHIIFPPTLQIVSVPKAQQIDGAGFSYHAEAKLEGQNVTLLRDFAETRTQGRCESADYVAQREVIKRIEKSVNAQILYQEK